jgi:L-aspartate oxidase
VFLDLRPVFKDGKEHSFPQAMEAARQEGFDPAKEPVPVIPAAHYHMGGIQTDRCGRTSLDGLWACGEVATTGIHGANRLASNSLLEALVYARRVAADIAGRPNLQIKHPVSVPAEPGVPPDTALVQLDGIVDAVRNVMSRNVGVLRSGKGLAKASSQLSELNEQMQSLTEQNTPWSPPTADRVRRWSEAGNVLLVARLVTLAALQRQESRGAHYRDDYPKSTPEWKRHQSLTVDQLNAA